MTDKEVAEIIKVAKAEVEWEYPMEYAAAFDRAIKALEQGSCEDAVSRADVLDLCDSKDAEYKVKHFREDVECLPSVYPKQKSGHWIVDNEYVDIRKMYHYSVHCSNCNYRGDYSTDEEDSVMSNFCPNCGAKMIEPQESDIEKLKPCINYEDGCEEWAGCPCVYYKAEIEPQESKE